MTKDAQHGVGDAQFHFDQFYFMEEEVSVGTLVHVYDKALGMEEPAASLFVPDLQKLGAAIVDEYGRPDDA